MKKYIWISQKWQMKLKKAWCERTKRSSLNENTNQINSITWVYEPSNYMDRRKSILFEIFKQTIVFISDTNYHSFHLFTNLWLSRISVTQSVHENFETMN